MKTKAKKKRLRLLKAILFIAGLIAYGYAEGWISTILFAFCFSLYLLELYKGVKK